MLLVLRVASQVWSPRSRFLNLQLLPLTLQAIVPSAAEEVSLKAILECAHLLGRDIHGPIPVYGETLDELSAPLVHTNFPENKAKGPLVHTNFA